MSISCRTQRRFGIKIAGLLSFQYLFHNIVTVLHFPIFEFRFEMFYIVIILQTAHMDSYLTSLTSECKLFPPVLFIDRLKWTAFGICAVFLQV